MNTTQDEIVMSVGGIPDSEGQLLDVHETLYHSTRKGFYIHRVITQIRSEGNWSVALLHENGQQPTADATRLIEEIEPLSKDEVIRYIVEIYMPNINGLKEMAFDALDRGGIKTCD